ncbi:MAG: ATPase [Rhodospirillaceae bacterium]|nr:ATPase [Rhodospirillaceae bacterium]
MTENTPPPKDQAPKVDTSKLAVKEAPRPKTKRVYKTVEVASDAEGWHVLLDGKHLITPMRKPLATPAKALAEAIAAEWDGQKEFVEPENMPLMRLLSTAIDRVAPERAMMIDELVKYADTDLLCYRAAHPAVLKSRQETLWQPVLDWVAAKHGASLIVVDGILPAEQSTDTVANLKAAIAALSDIHLTAFQASAAITSSLTLSLAFVQGRLSAAEVFAASQLDETYQIEMWGEDELAAERRNRIAIDLDGIGNFLKLTAL